MRKKLLTILALIVVATAAYGLWAGKETDKGVKIMPNMKTPLPAGWYTAGAYEHREKPERYLKVANGQIIEKSQAEKDAADAAAAAEMTAAMAAWKAAKPEILKKLENRLVEAMEAAETALKADGVIPEAFQITPTNTTSLTMAAWLLELEDHELAAGLSARLTVILGNVETITQQAIGMPPDGSTILYNVQSHQL
jgi:hypothetical protein